MIGRINDQRTEWFKANGCKDAAEKLQECVPERSGAEGEIWQKLAGNKPPLKNPGQSPRQEVLFPILSDLCVPFAADENLNTPRQGKVWRKHSERRSFDFGCWLIKKINRKRRWSAVVLSRAKRSGKLQAQAQIWKTTAAKNIGLSCFVCLSFGKDGEMIRRQPPSAVGPRYWARR